MLAFYYYFQCCTELQAKLFVLFLEIFTYILPEMSAHILLYETTLQNKAL